MRSTRRRLFTPGTILVSLLLATPTTSLPQELPGASRGRATARRESILAREAETQNRESTRTLNQRKAGSPQLSPADRKLIVNQIVEDFERIQIANLEMLRVSVTLDPAACKQISKLAEEMNKRARRLKSNLGVPDLEGAKKNSETPAMDEAQFRASLLALNASVRSFVSNPIFRDPRVRDLRELSNLQRDIANVIELSRTTKKAAVKLQ